MTTDKQALRQQILAQIDRCAELAYAAGSHFAEHGKHAPSSIMTKADADAKLVDLIEEYASPAPTSATAQNTPGDEAKKREQIKKVLIAAQSWRNATLPDSADPPGTRLALRDELRACVYELAGLPLEPIDAVLTSKET